MSQPPAITLGRIEEAARLLNRAAALLERSGSELGGTEREALHCRAVDVREQHRKVITARRALGARTA